jgi:hypothetical protein
MRSLGEKLVLKWVLKEYVERMWTAFMSRMIINYRRALVYMVINFQLPKKIAGNLSN